MQLHFFQGLICKPKMSLNFKININRDLKNLPAYLYIAKVRVKNQEK